MSIPVSITVKSPQDCSPGELGDFAALVVAGGEIIREGLEGRVLAAHALFLLREDSCLLGIAALKNPAAPPRDIVHRRSRKPAPRLYRRSIRLSSAGFSSCRVLVGENCRIGWRKPRLLTPRKHKFLRPLE